jgi:hypothetical protein
MNDGYTTVDQQMKLLNSCLQRSTSAGLRDRLAFCLGHFGLLRSNNILGVELADLSAVELMNEGPSPCFALVIVLNNGKTNQSGRLEYAAMIRNENVEICPLGAAAFYLFHRCVLSFSPFLPSQY